MILTDRIIIALHPDGESIAELPDGIGGEHEVASLHLQRIFIFIWTASPLYPTPFLFHR